MLNRHYDGTLVDWMFEWMVVWESLNSCEAAQ